MIEVRKLVAVDMVALGTQVTVTAYALGIILPLLFGLFSLFLNFMAPHAAAWQAALGSWMLSVALNYVVLFAYALAIMRSGTARQEGMPELANVGRYAVQQGIILVPLLVAGLALVQEGHRRQALP